LPTFQKPIQQQVYIEASPICSVIKVLPELSYKDIFHISKGLIFNEKKIIRL
jgi:hypothetical protein